MIQRISPKQFFSLSYFFTVQLQNFLPQRRAQTVKESRRPKTTDDPEGGPKALNDREPAAVGHQLQPPSALSDSPRREQPEPLPKVKRSQQFISLKI